MQIVKKYWIGIIAAGLILVASGMIYVKLHPKTLPENLIEGSGRIDGDLVNLNTKYPGRVRRMLVEDGTLVKKGMIVAVLDKGQ